MSKGRSLILLLSVSLLASIATRFQSNRISAAGQKQDRIITHKTWAHEPVKIVAVKTRDRDLSLGRSVSSDENWLRGLTLRIKNISKKNIVFVEVELHCLRPKAGSDEPITAFPLSSGPIAVESPKLLRPGESWDLTLSDEEYENFIELLRTTNYIAGAKNVEVITSEVVFDDNTKWVAGRIRPQEPKSDPRGPNQGKIFDIIAVASILADNSAPYRPHHRMSPVASHV